MQLILSLFPGIGLLDRAFENAGFCVVRGPDLIWGGDITNFTPPPNKFDGVIGGSPCQDFSKARRTQSTGNGLKMLKEYKRVVEQTKCQWWLLENVPEVPDLTIDGYSWQRLDLNASDFGSKQRRKRHIQFGAKDNKQLFIDRQVTDQLELPTVLASDDTPISEKAYLQGLPHDFDIPSFTRAALSEAIGNGVPYPMAEALANAVINRKSGLNLCNCSCGRLIKGRQKYATNACRKRVHDRKKSLIQSATSDLKDLTNTLA